MRRVIAVLWCLVALGLVDRTILARERHLRDGRTIFLELAPIDPRSLMQGDYMALRFMVESAAVGADRDRQSADGHIVVKLGERGVGKVVRRDAGEPLAADEARLRYRVREGKVKFATNAFFFQEGTAKYYERARYGEFRVAPNGDLLLTHMIGANFERLGPPPR